MVVRFGKKYINLNYKSYPNEYTEQSEKLCNDIYALSRYWENNKTHSDFLNELTDEQKIYFSLINFESQVINDGVDQFFINCPELSILVLDGLKRIGIEPLAKDYENTFKEYFGKFETIQELYSRFLNEDVEWNKRWGVFNKGYKELRTAIFIEDYFYREDFVKYFQSKIIQFVRDNKSNLLIEE